MQSEMTGRPQTEEAFREWIDECQKAEATTSDDSLDRS
jgi:hypothetical protein